MNYTFLLLACGHKLTALINYLAIFSFFKATFSYINYCSIHSHFQQCSAADSSQQHQRKKFKRINFLEVPRIKPVATEWEVQMIAGYPAALIKWIILSDKFVFHECFNHLAKFSLPICLSFSLSLSLFLSQSLSLSLSISLSFSLSLAFYPLLNLSTYHSHTLSHMLTHSQTYIQCRILAHKQMLTHTH